MKKMKKILLCFFLLLSAALFADRDQLHRKAALEMMQASGVPHMLKRSFEAQLEYQIKAVPELEKYRSQLTAFYAKAFSFKELASDLCALYMKHYTREELQQITAFYKTPAGRKKAKTDVQLSASFGKLFQEHAEKKMPELQKLLQQLIKE